MSELDSRKIYKGIAGISPQYIREAGEPMEKETPRRVVRFRPLLVAAVILVFTFVLAVGANAATGGELFDDLVSLFRGIEAREELVEEVRIDGWVVRVSNSTREDGSPILVLEDQGAGTALKELPDGRLVIVYEENFNDNDPQPLYEVVRDSDGRALGLREIK